MDHDGGSTVIAIAWFNVTTLLQTIKAKTQYEVMALEVWQAYKITSNLAMNVYIKDFPITKEEPLPHDKYYIEVTCTAIAVHYTCMYLLNIQLSGCQHLFP